MIFFVMLVVVFSGAVKGAELQEGSRVELTSVVHREMRDMPNNEEEPFVFNTPGLELFEFSSQDKNVKLLLRNNRERFIVDFHGEVADDDIVMQSDFYKYVKFGDASGFTVCRLCAYELARVGFLRGLILREDEVIQQPLFFSQELQFFIEGALNVMRSRRDVFLMGSLMDNQVFCPNGKTRIWSVTSALTQRPTPESIKIIVGEQALEGTLVDSPQSYNSYADDGSLFHQICEKLRESKPERFHPWE